MAVVVDTSVILAVVLNEATKPALIQRTVNVELVAPASLHWEIGNALSALLKRSRITVDEAQQALVAYQTIPIRFLDVPLDTALAVAAQYGLYAYDAYMVVCAQQMAAALLTLDKGLSTAAHAAHIHCLEVIP